MSMVFGRRCSLVSMRLIGRNTYGGPYHPWLGFDCRFAIFEASRAVWKSLAACYRLLWWPFLRHLSSSCRRGAREVCSCMYSLDFWLYRRKLILLACLSESSDACCCRCFVRDQRRRLSPWCSARGQKWPASRNWPHQCSCAQLQSRTLSHLSSCL